MDDDRLDLRSLADVESPDVVRSALRDFRRRALTKYLFALVVSAIIVAAFMYPLERGLVDRIETADESALVGYSVQVGDATWTLVRVADLGDTLGLEWLVWPHDAPGSLSFPTVSFAGVRGSEGLGQLERFEIEKPASGVVRGTTRVPRSPPEPFALDLRELGVPARFWEGS